MEKLQRLFTTTDPKAAMAAAAVLVSATGGAGAGLRIATGVYGPASWSGGHFLWWALVTGDAVAMAHLASADLTRVGAAEIAPDDPGAVALWGAAGIASDHAEGARNG